MFDGFTLTTIDTGEVSIRARIGGRGPPLLLSAWQSADARHVAPGRACAQRSDFTVVATDLTGYGMSSKPPSSTDHERYSKRAMARDQIAVMRKLGSSASMWPVTIEVRASATAWRSTVQRRW